MIFGLVDKELSMSPGNQLLAIESPFTNVNAAAVSRIARVIKAG